MTTPIDGAITFPEDTGTGVPTAREDWTSAGHFGGQQAQQNRSDYVERGLEFDIDFVAGELSISDGLAYILHDEPVNVQDNDGDYNDVWDQGMTITAAVPDVGAIPLEAPSTNFIYLSLDLFSNNGASYVVEQEEIPPDSPALLIGLVDTETETVHKVHREPQARFTARPHRTEIERGETVEIPEGYGEVLAGPIEGEGRITGEGRLKVI